MNMSTPATPRTVMKLHVTVRPNRSATMFTVASGRDALLKNSAMITNKEIQSHGGFFDLLSFYDVSQHKQLHRRLLSAIGDCKLVRSH